MDLAASGSFFPLHVALDKACHPRGVGEGLAVEERKWEMLGSHPSSFPVTSLFQGRMELGKNLSECLEGRQDPPKSETVTVPAPAFSVGLRGAPGPWVREPRSWTSALTSRVPPPFSSSFPLTFQETPRDTKTPPPSKLRSKEKDGQGVGQWSDLDLCVSEKRETLSKKSPSYVNNLEKERVGVGQGVKKTETDPE